MMVTSDSYDNEYTDGEYNTLFRTRIEEDLSCSRKTVLIENSEPLAEITLLERKLTVAGWNITSQHRAEPPAEYDYCITFDECNTTRLLTEMRCEYGVEESFGELFAGKFPGESFCSSFMAYCIIHGIACECHYF